MIALLASCKAKKETVVEAPKEPAPAVVEEQPTEPLHAEDPEEEDENSNNDREPKGPADWTPVTNLSALAAEKGIGDHYELDDVSQLGEFLVIKVSYSGGCKSHDFTLYTEKGSSDTEQFVLLHHNGNKDMCEAWESEEIKFHLPGIADNVKTDQVIFKFMKKSLGATYVIRR